MNSSELLTRTAIESLRANARAPAPLRTAVLPTPGERLALLNAILLRDQDVASLHDGQRRRIHSGRTRL